MNPPEPPPSVPYFGFRLASFATADFIDWIASVALASRPAEGPAAPRTDRPADRAARRGALAGYFNAATTNLALEDPELAALLPRFDCLYADGQGVVRAARRLGAPVAERINAGDFVVELLRRCAGAGVAIGLVGGRPGEAAGFAGRARELAPGVRIVVALDGYFDEAEETRSGAVRAAIEAADPDLVIVGMGSPRQERWAVRWADAAAREGGRGRAWWCVGALFEYYAGTRARAPVWARRAGLEWLFRLALEPRRLWRRYLIGNPKFLLRVERERRRLRKEARR